MTHYLPPFTVTVGVRQRACCGQLIDPRSHSIEPQCVACQQWIEKDTEAFEALEAEPPAPNPVTVPDFDPITGDEWDHRKGGAR